MSELLVVPIDELDNIIDVTRAGVIPYATIDNKVHWLMGVSPEGRLSDFGGGCPKRESGLICLLRETDEEAGKYMADVVHESILRGEGLILWKAQSLRGPPYRYLLFAPIPVEDYQAQFVPNSEVSRLVWIEQEEALSANITLFHEPLMQYIRKFRTVDIRPK